MRSVLLTLVLLAPAAPAPLPRSIPAPVPARSIVGDWSLAWGQEQGTAHLGQKGDWSCQLGGSEYVGTWRTEGGVLIITERAEGSDRWHVYRVQMDGVLHGRIDSGGRFRLEALEGRR